MSSGSIADPAAVDAGRPGTRCSRRRTCATPFMRHEYLRRAARTAAARPRPPAGSRASSRSGAATRCRPPAPLYLKATPTASTCSTGPGPTPTSSTAWPTTPRAWSPCRSRRCRARGCWRATTRRAQALLRCAAGLCRSNGLSSLHLLFLDGCRRRRLRAGRPDAAPRRAVPLAQPGLRADFDDFLAGLAQDKRKKIRQERRKVAEAGVSFRALRGERHRAKPTGTSSTAATNAPTGSTATRPT